MFGYSEQRSKIVGEIEVEEVDVAVRRNEEVGDGEVGLLVREENQSPQGRQHPTIVGVLDLRHYVGVVHHDDFFTLAGGYRCIHRDIDERCLAVAVRIRRHVDVDGSFGDQRDLIAADISHMEKKRLEEQVKENFFGKSLEKERHVAVTGAVQQEESRAKVKTEEMVEDDNEVIAAERPGDGAELGIENTLPEKIKDTSNTVTEAVREICKPEEGASGQQGEPERLQRSRLPQKRAAPETTDSDLTFQLRQHKMFLTMIESGLSQLISDEETPETMVGSLTALKHYTTFPTENSQPPNKRIKPSAGIPKVEKQEEEYFEQDTIKIEPKDQSPAEVSSSQQ